MPGPYREVQRIRCRAGAMAAREQGGSSYNKIQKKRTLYRYSVLFVIQQFEDGKNYLDFSSSRRSSRSQTPSMYCTPRARSYLP